MRLLLPAVTGQRLLDALELFEHGGAAFEVAGNLTILGLEFDAHHLVIQLHQLDRCPYDLMRVGDGRGGFAGLGGDFTDGLLEHIAFGVIRPCRLLHGFLHRVFVSDDQKVGGCPVHLEQQQRQRLGGAVVGIGVPEPVQVTFAVLGGCDLSFAGRLASACCRAGSDHQRGEQCDGQIEVRSHGFPDGLLRAREIYRIARGVWDKALDQMTCLGPMDDAELGMMR